MAQIIPIDSKRVVGRSLEDIQNLVAEQLVRVDSLNDSLLTAKATSIAEIGKHIIGSGGKRIRPMVVLLTTQACNYEGEDDILLASLIEYLHTAMLLHDDVIDESDRRRGQPSANRVWGNSLSILVGDFIYSRAFNLMVAVNRMDVISILSDITTQTAEGEVLQLENIGNVNLTESDYMEIIRLKSALLFQAAAHTAAVLSHSTPAVLQNMRNYGLNLGIAFQLIDDVLDYYGDSTMLGKNVGKDFAEGKLTLPLIAAMQAGSSLDRALIQNAIQERSSRDLPKIIDAVRQCGALEHTIERATMHTDLALQALRHDPPNETYRQALGDLASIVLQRVA